MRILPLNVLGLVLAVLVCQVYTAVANRYGEIDSRIVSLDETTEAMADSASMHQMSLEDRVDLVNRVLRYAPKEVGPDLITELMDSTNTGSVYLFSHVHVAAFEDEKRVRSRRDWLLNGERRKIHYRVTGQRVEDGVEISVISPMPSRRMRVRNGRGKCNRTFGGTKNRTRCGSPATYKKVTAAGSHQYRCQECFVKGVPDDYEKV